MVVFNTFFCVIILILFIIKLHIISVSSCLLNLIIKKINLIILCNENKKKELMHYEKNDKARNLNHFNTKFLTVNDTAKILNFTNNRNII